MWLTLYCEKCYHSLREGRCRCLLCYQWAFYSLYWWRQLHDFGFSTEYVELLLCFDLHIHAQHDVHCQSWMTPLVEMQFKMIEKLIIFVKYISIAWFLIQTKEESKKTIWLCILDVWYKFVSNAIKPVQTTWLKQQMDHSMLCKAYKKKQN